MGDSTGTGGSNTQDAGRPVTQNIQQPPLGEGTGASYTTCYGWGPYAGYMGAGPPDWGAGPYAAPYAAYMGGVYPYRCAGPKAYPWQPLPGEGAPTGPPLRVTHLGSCLLRGGVEMWLQGLIRFLDPARVRVVKNLVTVPEQLDLQLAAELGVPFALGDRDSVRQAARESDVLLCWGPPELAAWLSDCRPKLAVFVAHGEGDWTRHILHACAPAIDHVIAVSRRVAESLGTRLPVTQIANGIDAGRLGPTRSRRAVREALGFQPEDFVLGYVGRFANEKRPYVLVEAVARLPLPFKALLVGWGPLRPWLLDFANERIPGRYAVIGAANDLGDYYTALDALCLPSAEEGYALVILEAMMCGRPVIATPVGCVPEVIEDRINGLVVPGTAESFAAAADLLHRHPAWAQGLAAEGRAFAEEYGHARTMARRYEELLLRLWREKQAA